MTLFWNGIVSVFDRLVWMKVVLQELLLYAGEKRINMLPKGSFATKFPG